MKITFCRNLKRLFFTGMVWGLACVGSSAQIPASEKTLEGIEKTMEANLSWNLETALLTYFPETKFVVKANVQLEKVRKRKPLPPLPDVLLKKEVMSLPGLPFIPGQGNDNEQENDQFREVAENSGMQVKRLNVNVLVDKSFTEGDWAFIRRLVSLSADMDPKRGDRVSVEAFDFPVKANYFNRLGTKSLRDSSKQEAFTQSLFPDEQLAGMDWRPFIFAAVIAGIFLIILFWGMNSILKKLSPERPKVMPEPTPSSEQKPQDKETEASSDEAAFRTLKSSVVDAIIGTPRAAAQVIKTWVKTDERNGPRDAAILFRATSKHLNGFLAEHLGAKISADVQQHVEEVPEDEVVTAGPELIKRFDENLRNTAISAIRNEEEIDALAFLHQLSDDQLLHLIKPLKDGVRAIVLAQLQPERAYKLIKSLEPRKQPAALAAMGNVEKVPADVYQHIARQLLVRAKDVESMRFVRSDGIDALVNILDFMDDFDQEQILEYIETQDLNLSQRIKAKYMTFSQLVELPAEKVRELAFTVDRDLLAKSLIHVDDSTVNRIIEALPDKLAEMVQASLEASNDVTDEEVTLARRQLMRTVRQSAISKEMVK
ncbi:MAG: hypothetical protein DWQ05_18565 [Calditrichaeota bacterium]|nr:MAG: hypothetical protein DWQ05_18565 [Calditrichota bacterium]